MRFSDPAIRAQYRTLTLSFVPSGSTTEERFQSIMQYIVGIDPETVRESCPDIDEIQVSAAELLE
jgi:hypothetical protein